MKNDPIISVTENVHQMFENALFQLSTILILYAKSVYYLYVSRFLGGLVSGAIIVGIPTLVNDISYDK